MRRTVWMLRMRPGRPEPPGLPGAGPVVIVGCQRSGTTLLRSMLNAHPDIALGYECDFFERLAPVYGGLQDIRPHLDGFLTDLAQVERFGYWRLSRAELRAAFDAKPGAVSYAEAVWIIAGTYRDKHRPAARLTGFKSPNTVQRLDGYFGLFPEGRVLHIIRDPRAVLASELKKRRRSGAGCNRYLQTVRVGRRYRRARAAQLRFVADPRVYALRYEDLIRQPADTLAGICAWLRLPMAPGMLTHHLSADTPEQEKWQHGLTMQPPQRARLTGYQSELTAVETAAIGYMCRAYMGREAGRALGVSGALFLASGWASWLMAGVARRGAHLIAAVPQARVRASLRSDTAPGATSASRSG